MSTTDAQSTLSASTAGDHTDLEGRGELHRNYDDVQTDDESNIMSGESNILGSGGSNMMSISSQLESDAEINTSRQKQFSSLKNAIQALNFEAAKAEEMYRAEGAQVKKLTKVIQEQDAELAAAEEALQKEARHRESAEKHFIKLKKMMVVKDVEVSEAESQRKAEQELRKGAEKEIAMLCKQLKTKDAMLATAERKYQKECKKREKFESQMQEIARKAGRKSDEEKYQHLLKLREEDERNNFHQAPSESSDISDDFGPSDKNWKQKGEEDSKLETVLEELMEFQEELKATKEELNRVKGQFSRERELREEADKQLIAMREKGFAYHLDKRAAAQNHVKDCLSSEKLKLRCADLQEQYDALKTEATKSLEKARDRLEDERDARDMLEHQIQEDKKEHKKQIDELNQQVTDAEKRLKEMEEKLKDAESKVKDADKYNETEADLRNLRQKYAAFQQQVIDAKAECRREQNLREEMQYQQKKLENELDNMESQLNNTAEALKKMEDLYKQELANCNEKQRQISELRLSAAQGSESNYVTKQKIIKLEEQLNAAEARCRVSKEKWQEEELLREKFEAEVSRLHKSLEQISDALQSAHSRREEGDKECERLKKKVRELETELQKAILQEENAEHKHSRLQQQIMTLSTELEITKSNCMSLTESLEKAEAKCREEKELREKAEESLCREDQSSARKRREEPEHGILDVEASLSQWRTERKLREEAEEKVRTLREDLFQLQHEHILSGQNQESPCKQNGELKEKISELEKRIAQLESELEISKSHLKVAKESLDNERHLREDLEQQLEGFRAMMPEYTDAEDRYEKERRLRSEAEDKLDDLRQQVVELSQHLQEARNQHKNDGLMEAVAIEDMQKQLIDLESELIVVKNQCAEAQKKFDKAHHELLRERRLREAAERENKTLQHQRQSFGSSDRNDDPEIEKKLREKAEKQLMALRLKVEAMETEIECLRDKLSASQSSLGSDLGARPEKGMVVVPNNRKTKISPVQQLPYRQYNNYKTRMQEEHQTHLNMERHQKHSIMLNLPDYVKNNFGRIGFVKHSTIEHWPALVLDPFDVPLSIRKKWLELYHDFHKRDMFLVYLYGRIHTETVNAYPIVEPHHFIAYEEGIENNFDQIPAIIEQKVNNCEELDELEAEFVEGIRQIRIDARRHPRHRTHPLQQREARLSLLSSTSSTSYDTSSESGEEKKQEDSPTKRPRSEYSLPSTHSKSAASSSYLLNKR